MTIENIQQELAEFKASKALHILESKQVICIILLR